MEMMVEIGTEWNGWDTVTAGERERESERDEVRVDDKQITQPHRSSLKR
jgi:hypothetical protein